MDREIPISGALLGAEIEIPTLEGRQLKVKVPAGSKPQARLRLKGYGLPTGPGGVRGDLLVRVNLLVPAKLSPEQQELVQKLAATGL